MGDNLDHEIILELLPAFALDALEPGEMRLVSEHLVGCNACRAEFDALRQAAGLLAMAAPPAEPPAHLRAKILDIVGAEAPVTVAKPQSSVSPQPPAASWPAPAHGRTPASVDTQTRPVPHLRKRLDERLRGWLWRISPALALAGVLLVVGLSVSNVMLWQQVRSQAATPAPSYGMVHLQGAGNTPQDPSGLLVVSRDGMEGALIVDRLPQLDAARQYQLWLVKDGQRTSGGVFSVDEIGYATLEVYSAQPLNSYTSFGITVEPAGGSPGPTGERVLAGTFE